MELGLFGKKHALGRNSYQDIVANINLCIASFFFSCMPFEELNHAILQVISSESLLAAQVGDKIDPGDFICFVYNIEKFRHDEPYFFRKKICKM